MDTPCGSGFENGCWSIWQTAAVVGPVPMSPQIAAAPDVFPFPGTDDRPIGDVSVDTRDAVRLLQFSAGLIARLDLGPTDAESRQGFDLHSGWHDCRATAYVCSNKPGWAYRWKSGLGRGPSAE